MALPEAHRRARVPRWALTLVGAALFLAAIWSVLWLFLSNRAEGAFESWLASERSAGRQWACADHAVGGYPFAVTLRCAHPTFRGEIAGRTADGSLEGLTAGVRLDRPRRLRVALGGPLILRSEAEDFRFTASWADLAATVDDIGSPGVNGGFAASRLAVTLETARQGDLNLRAATAGAEAARSATGPGDIAFSLAAGGLAFPTLDALPGLDGLTEAEARGVLVRADILRAPTRSLLDAWRTAGGALHLSALNIDKGPFRGTASGTLALDEAHRPAGKLDTSVSGFEPIAARFGIPLAGVKIGGLLGTLLGGGKSAPADPGGILLPVTLEGGGVFVGPFRTGLRLDPLY